MRGETEMVLKIKRHTETDARTDPDANVPVGAPKPSHVRELLLTLKTRLEAQLNGNGNANSNGVNGAAYKIEMPEMVKMTDWSYAAGDLHDTIVERAVQDNILRQL